MKTKQVGQKIANGFGLFDMQGNVVEWCQDAYVLYNPKAAIDPQSPPGPNAAPLVMRGGTFGSPARHSRAALRYGNHADIRNFGTGFRVARTHH